MLTRRLQLPAPSFVSNYLREEIQQEALVRRLDSFARFLQVAAVMNGQVSNIAGVAAPREGERGRQPEVLSV